KLNKTTRENKKVGPDPWDGRTLEWTVDSPSPENTFEPMPVVDDLNPLAKAKNENRKMETTNEHRSSPIARDSIIPFLISMTLGVFGICMTYVWYIAAFVVGAVVFAFFILDRKSTRLNYSHVSISYAHLITFSLHDALPILNPLAKAKNENRKMETTNEHRSSPIARDSIIPFLISMTLGVFGICMTYEWYIAAFVVGAVVFAFFILRALTDEKNDYYGKDEGGAS